MATHFYLWGAPCREQQREASILQLRGYTVRTLADEREDHALPAGPRTSMRLQACAMLTAAAVIIDSHTEQAEQRRCLALCKEMGVRAVFSAELPMVPPPAHLLEEQLDALDRSQRYQAMTPPERMAVPPATRTQAASYNLRRMLPSWIPTARNIAYR